MSTGSLNDWIESQWDIISRNVRAVKDKPFFHISTNPNLKEMQPRVPRRTVEGEDLTVPRICGCETIDGCIYGFQSMYASIRDSVSFDGTKWSKVDYPIYTIYQLPVEDIIRPSNKLVPNSVLTKELWIVGNSMESQFVSPVKVGCLLPIRSTEMTTKKGKEIRTTFLIRTNTDIKLGDDKLSAGFYKFSITGDMVPSSKDKVTKPYGVKEVSATDWKYYSS